MADVHKRKFRPLQDRVLVIIHEQEEVLGSGIVIPDNAKEKPCKGEVIAVGNGKYLDNGELRPLDVKVGDIVIFSKYSGTEIKLQDNEVELSGKASLDDKDKLLVLRQDDIVGVL